MPVLAAGLTWDTMRRRGGTLRGVLARLLLLCGTVPAARAQPYEGYADALTTGGDGGEEVWVTSLDDAGPGSFRAAVAGLTGRPTVIKFAVAGKVCVRREVRITRGNVTV